MAYEPPQRFYGGLAFGLYETVPNAPLFSVLNVVDSVVDFGANTLTITCTTRATAVLAVELPAIKDVRRIIVPEDGVAAVELDLQTFENTSGVGAQWKQYVATIASIRVDAGLIAALFTSAVHYQRKAVALSPGGIPRMLISPVVSVGLNGATIGGAASRNGNNNAFGAQDAELAVIRQRRSERQRRLVNSMMLGFSLSGETSVTDMGALSGRSLFDAEAVVSGSQAEHLRSGGGLPATDSLLDVHWCRWCNEYVPLASHARICPNRPVECSWCGERMKSKVFESHKFECGAAERKAHMVASNDPRLQILASNSAARQRTTSDANADDSVSMAEASGTRRRRESIDRAENDEEDDADGASPARGDHECMWCHKYYDKAHQKVCPHREVMCRKCLQPVKVKDKKAHRLTCVRATEGNQAASGSKESSIASTSPATTPRTGKPSVTFKQ